MDKTINEILTAISNRFSKGRESSRILRMIEKDTVDYNEILENLNQIKKFGGSDKYYTELNDQLDADFYIRQIKEYIKIKEQ